MTGDPDNLTEALSFGANRGTGYAQYGTGLTGREVEILELKCDGLTNKAVAYEVSISEQTVKNHITSMLARTGAPNMVALATKYARFQVNHEPLVLDKNKPRIDILEERMDRFEERLAWLENVMRPLEEIVTAFRRVDPPGTDRGA